MTRRMESGQSLAAPCGVYCGVCRVYIAHRDNDQQFKERLTSVYGLDVCDIRCKGCRSNQLFPFCQTCQIRSCADENGIEGCHQCGQFPCEFIENFPVHYWRRVILRAIPARIAQGIDRWIQEEERRYHCPYCGYDLFMGAEKCWNCKEPVDVD